MVEQLCNLQHDCTTGCNYSLCTPDDGCGRHPKHVEWLGSKINKDCLELHLVGCLKRRFMMYRNMHIKCEKNLLKKTKWIIKKGVKTLSLRWIWDRLWRLEDDGTRTRKRLLKVLQVYTYSGDCVWGFVCLSLAPQWARASSFTWFLDHTQRHTTVGKTPLDEWSVRRRDLYSTTHNNHNSQTSLHPVGFEPTISAGERPQTYTLDHAALEPACLEVRLQDN